MKNVWKKAAACILSASLAVSGSGLSVWADGENEEFQSSIPASVAAYAKVDVVFKKGAEGSTVTTMMDGASANVQNRSKGTVELIGKAGCCLMPGEKGKVSANVGANVGANVVRKIQQRLTLLL